MTLRFRHSSRGQRGTAMVETAMVLPLLFLVLLGTLEFGLLFSRYQMVLASARAGARVASLYRLPCKPQQVKTDVDASVRANTNQLGILVMPSNVLVSGACSPGNNVEVTVSFDHYLTLIGGFLPSNFRVPLRATVRMRNE
jgi:Flp pilus assembly protein TadG